MRNNPVVYPAYEWAIVRLRALEYVLPILGEVRLMAIMPTHPRIKPNDNTILTQTIIAADGLLLTSRSGDQYRLVGEPAGWGEFMEKGGYEWDRAAPFKWRKLTWWQRLKKSLKRWWFRN